MQKIKQNDEVIVIAGRDLGKRGRVTRRIDEKRVYVSGINMVKRHTKPNPQLNQQGGIIEKEAPIHISNIAIFNPATNKGDRVGIKVLDDGSKVRVFRSNGEQIDG
ncbi:MAG: 50S ribosomal protein L24 [Gammaproteobacteria bacterium]|nr:50S ribosomal protein L24 [Gammaproteobacteria bacterium]